MHRPLRLDCSRDALAFNWRWFAEMAGTACGAAVKADGYGLGANEVVTTLYGAGCRDFFVSTWWEAQRLGSLPADLNLVVLHGVGPNDVTEALGICARPALNSPEQVSRWKEMAPGRPCDVMLDTGMNRLGLRPEEVEVLRGLNIHTLHSHLACADDDHPLNSVQLNRFRQAAAEIPAQRYSLANSAGVMLGRSFAFDLVRPGLGLYGGIPRVEARGLLRQVAYLQAQVIQRRTIKAGESCGYGARFVAREDTPAAIINIGYADGYSRCFSEKGFARAEDALLPVLGRVSMDLVALGCAAYPQLAEGDWVQLDFSLEEAAATSRTSQYELLTGLGRRFERSWH